MIYHYNKNNRLQGASLIDIQSPTYIENIIIENVITYYKPVINVLYNNIEFHNMDIKNINLYGDSNECYLIMAEMGGKNKNIIFHNVHVSNIIGNSNMMNFKGQNVDVIFNEIKIYNTTSNGPFVKNIAENINCQLNRCTIDNVQNINKLDDGIFHFKNNAYINITDSEFNNINSHSSGLLHFEKLKNVDIKITSSSFFKNHCNYNGGILNIIDNAGSNNRQDKKSLTIRNSVFKENNVNYFGGVVYVDSDDTNFNFTITSSIFENNYAGVAGGAIFFEKITTPLMKIKNDIFQEKNHFNNVLKNNMAVSHGNVYATHPAKFIHINKEKDINEIISGGSLSLTLQLQDEFENVVYDHEKYYSNIGIITELLDVYKTDISEYAIKETGNVFNNGMVKKKN
ncbi:hypothetical protein PIROE2DRAFT_16353, partial [Piromyces sp. E2]